MRRLGLAEVEREDRRARVAEAERDRFADAARRAGDDGDLAFEFPSAAMPSAAVFDRRPSQYISQPPLTLIVAPVM